MQWLTDQSLERRDPYQEREVKKQSVPMRKLAFSTIDLLQNFGESSKDVAQRVEAVRQTKKDSAHVRRQLVKQ